MNVSKYVRMAMAYAFIAALGMSWAKLEIVDSKDIPRRSNYSWENEKIADAIYKAEGTGSKYPYGIMSIDTHGDKAYARKICLNTIRNNKKRFMAQTTYRDFIVFLGSRYCPVGAKNDPQGLNVNWVKNVMYFLNKNK